MRPRARSWSGCPCPRRWPRSRACRRYQVSGRRAAPEPTAGVHHDAALRQADYRVQVEFAASGTSSATRDLLIYTIFTGLTIKREKPSLAEGINGGWLLAVVATQSIAVLIALLSGHWDQPLRLHANFVALSMWLWGGMVCIWIVSLIFLKGDGPG